MTRQKSVIAQIGALHDARIRKETAVAGEFRRRMFAARQDRAAADQEPAAAVQPIQSRHSEAIARANSALELEERAKAERIAELEALGRAVGGQRYGGGGSTSAVKRSDPAEQKRVDELEALGKAIAK